VTRAPKAKVVTPAGTARSAWPVVESTRPEAARLKTTPPSAYVGAAKVTVGCWASTTGLVVGLTVIRTVPVPGTEDRR